MSTAVLVGTGNQTDTEAALGIDNRVVGTEDTGTLGDTGIWEYTGATLKGWLATLGAAGTSPLIPEQERQRCPGCWSWTESRRARVPGRSSKAEETAAGSSRFQSSLWTPWCAPVFLFMDSMETTGGVNEDA